MRRANRIVISESIEPLGTIREWLVLSALLTLICGALAGLGVMRRADMLFFDIVAPLLHQTDEQKVTVVAIDDATLRALGGWPLRRSIHAALIDRLTQDEVSAIGLDFATTQPGRIEPSGDEQLAGAMQRNARVVTPALRTDVDGWVSALLPVTPIANASFGSGQIDVQRDLDGIVRSFCLVEGNRRRAYDHMAYLLLQAAGRQPTQCQEQPDADVGSWNGGCRSYVPIGRHPSYHLFSYLDVLRGQIPTSSLRGRIVIVGATASSAEIHFATPVVHGRSLSGVEFLAEATHALANGTLVRPVGRVYQVLFSLSVMPFLFGGLFFLGPRASLIACATIPIVVALVAFAILNVEHVFFFPSAAIITCAIAYPIWSWRRQEALLRYLSLEAELVMNEPSLPDEPAATSTILDPVARRLTVMTTAAARMRRYRAFVSDWVDSLPEATLVASSSGAVVMANDRARALLRGGDGESGRHAPLTGRPVADVLHEMTSSHRTTVFVARALASFSRCQQEGTSFDSDETAMDQGVEIVDAQDRSLLIKCATIKSSPGREGALIFHIANLTSIRRAERQRDITLRFLSHDIRSPQAAILALVELKRQDPVDMPEGKFTELVAQYAASTLNLADDFLFLARAESQPPRLVKIDLALLVGDAVDDVWPHARAKHTTVRLAAEPGMIVLADALLLRRAFANLIGNAIKFSPDGATVTVEAAELSAAWKVSVIDKGVGISEVRIQELFKEFVRLDADPSRPGHGLGLAFVKSVIESLGGEVSVQSGVTIGSTFSVVLPKAVDA